MMTRSDDVNEDCGSDDNDANDKVGSNGNNKDGEVGHDGGDDDNDNDDDVNVDVIEDNGDNQTMTMRWRRARLKIPVFRNLFFGPKKPFLTGFLRIFFLRFPEEFFTGTWFWRGSQEFLFFPFLQDFFAGIPVGQEFLYLPRNPQDSGGFLFPPKAAGSVQQLKKALC